MVGQPVGAAVQLVIAESVFFKYHSGGIRGTGRLLLEQLMDQGVLREIRLCGVEIYQ